MGHLLYLLGEVSEKTIRKYERDSLNIGKSSFAYAWVLDETGEERSRYDDILIYIIFYVLNQRTQLFTKLQRYYNGYCDHKIRN